MTLLFPQSDFAGCPCPVVGRCPRTHLKGYLRLIQV